jgi:hypothetical protein
MMPLAWQKPVLLRVLRLPQGPLLGLLLSS